MKIDLKKIGGWVLMLLLAVVLLYFAFKGVKWSDFISGLASCNFWWILLSMAASFAVFILRGIRWRYIMLPLNPSITRKEAYDGVTIAYLSNFALPRAGEFVRCGVISSTGKANFESVLGTVVLERSWDMLCYIFVLMGVLALRWERFGAFITQEIWKPLVEKLPFDIAWLILVVAVVVVAMAVLLYLKRQVLRKNRFVNKVFQIVEGLVKGLMAGVRMEHKWGFIVSTLLIWVGYWVMSYCTILAFPQVGGLTAVDAAFLMVVGSLGWIIPVQGGIGAYHFVISLALFSIYGIAQTSGVIFATISHESQALIMLICGTVSLFSLRKRKFTIFKHQNNN
ncbi:MAG: flippase-like domain-containing protein [Bacteroidales bacterium]|nr:flippase-like domain-containing protein [Bacteroidales bacterium]